MSNAVFEPKHCTTKGRIVYDRPKKPFTWRDLRRISTGISVPSGDPASLNDAFVVWVSITTALTLGISRGLTDDVKVVIRAAAGDIVARIFGLLIALAEVATDAVRSLVVALVDELTPK